MEALLTAVFGLFVWGAVAGFEAIAVLEQHETRLDEIVHTLDKKDTLIIDKMTERMNRMGSNAKHERSEMIDFIKHEVKENQGRIERLEGLHWRH